MNVVKNDEVKVKIWSCKGKEGKRWRAHLKRKKGTAVCSCLNGLKDQGNVTYMENSSERLGQCSRKDNTQSI